MNMVQELPPLEELETLVRVGRLRSFSKAARELHVSASAVSHRIASLEERIGLPLLERTTRSVVLTDTGRLLLPEWETALRTIHESLERVHRTSGVRPLTISCSPSFAILCLMPLLGQLRQERPELEVHVFADDRLADPRREDIDACIRYGAGVYPGLRSQRLTTEWVFPVCTPAFARTHRLRRAAQLCDLPLIHHDVLRDHPARVDWPRWLSRAGQGAEIARRGVHYSHAHLALRAAQAGEGIALGRTSLVAEALRLGHLVAPLSPRVRSGLAYHLVTAGPLDDRLELLAKRVRGALGRGTRRDRR